jgi:hypothetical protein
MANLLEQPLPLAELNMFIIEDNCVSCSPNHPAGRDKNLSEDGLPKFDLATITISRGRFRSQFIGMASQQA